MYVLVVMAIHPVVVEKLQLGHKWLPPPVQLETTGKMPDQTSRNLVNLDPHGVSVSLNQTHLGLCISVEANLDSGAFLHQRLNQILSFSSPWMCVIVMVREVTV